MDIMLNGVPIKIRDRLPPLKPDQGDWFVTKIALFIVHLILQNAQNETNHHHRVLPQMQLVIEVGLYGAGTTYYLRR